MSIIDLQETTPNVWKAKYRGNYGTYTIKIKTDGNKTVDFSCSCPSDYYPCKHIPMIEKAIKERIAKSNHIDNRHEVTLEQILKDVPQKELCDFIVRQAQNNPQFKNTVLLKFADKIKKSHTKSVNNYNQLLKEALEDLNYDYEDIGYDCDSIEIDVLDQWLSKAENFANQNNPEEAILICKACIEEYASWLEESGCDVTDYIDPTYEEKPFEILNQICTMQGIDQKDLLDYCKSEMSKSKYSRTEMFNGFSNLFMRLSVAVGSNDFILLQDRLLKEISDKSSYEAKTILKRKIDFYRFNDQTDKADEVIKENLQIESFREELTKKLIAENKLQEAKKLINDFITQKGTENFNHHSWLRLKLQIAQKENNITEIRRISSQFIETKFDTYYYGLYKTTFTKEVWLEQVEKLIKQYEKRYKLNWFNPLVAKVLQAEKQEERLMKYVEKHLSVDILEEYHTAFVSSFPEKTLAMFRQATDKYAQNTGRDIYNRIVQIFKEMVKIEGGSKLVREMISHYRVIYKNRKAMMEIINKF